MARLLFARGAHGIIICSLQTQLHKSGHYTGLLDGDFGPRTEVAVRRFQQESRLVVTGRMDDTTWSRLMDGPIPSVFERALQLTAAFEGHGFGKVQGNWDGAWLTWGIVGFTLKHGGISSLVREIHTLKPALLSTIFGNHSLELLAVMSGSPTKQEAWARRTSDGSKVVEPWRSGFQRLGDNPTVQATQLAHARTAYFTPALRTASTYNLRSERGIALCFDIHVQNGGIHPAIHGVITRANPLNADEPHRRLTIATAVAEAAIPQFREDVRRRKVAIATGLGMVHGVRYNLDDWGLAECHAQDLR